MNYENPISVTGVITDITNCSNDCYSQLITITVDGQQINIIMTQDTFVADTMRIMPGMRAVAFYDSTRPVPLIYSPQYRTDMIAVLRPGEDITLAYFDSSLMAIDNSLQLNLYQFAIISTLNGQAYLCPPGDHYLMAYYTATTKSIPPQTAPNWIIVLCQTTIPRYLEEHNKTLKTAVTVRQFLLLM